MSGLRRAPAPLPTNVGQSPQLSVTVSRMWIACAASTGRTVKVAVAAPAGIGTVAPLPIAAVEPASVTVALPKLPNLIFWMALAVPVALTVTVSRSVAALTSTLTGGLGEQIA